MSAPRKFRDLAARLRDNNYHSSREILAGTLLFNYSTILEALDKAGREPELFSASIHTLREVDLDT